jgi:dTDP-4-amino-4,6-dideoxygalactose transaminase
MINVTKAFLPPIEQFNKYVADIFNRCWLTNNGPLINELEQKLKKYLGINNILVLNNGTIALQIAIKALDLKGEIITTPFSYVATTSSIVWEQCTPVFVDILPETFNIDPKLIEAAITDKTTAILATHVFGNPCDIDAIKAIADKHNLKVIYDAAHTFGVKYKGQSVFNYGDISTTSFHATKLFHTTEGGAVFTNNDSISHKMSLLRNFGHTSPVTFDGMGINAKNSELHAAMGLCVLDHIDAIREKRKLQWEFYYEKLSPSNLQLLKITEGTDEYNYSYFPVVFASEEKLLAAIEVLNLQYVNPRRYFYPSLNGLNYVNRQPCPISEDLSARILCLPLYHDLSSEEQSMIVRLLN